MYTLIIFTTLSKVDGKMKEKALNATARRMQLMLEDAGERTLALRRLLAWAAEEAQLLGHDGQAQSLRELSQQLASKGAG